MPKVFGMQKKGGKKFKREKRESLSDLIYEIEDPKIRKVLLAIAKIKG